MVYGLSVKKSCIICIYYIYDIIKNKTLEFMFLNVECTANIEKINDAQHHYL